jgi:hypothetical protein
MPAVPFSCPHCGNKLDLSPFAPGTTIACSSCQQHLSVPTIQTQIPQATQAEGSQLFAIDTASPRRTRSRKRTRRGRNQKRERNRNEDSDQTTNLILGIAGASMLFIGFFCPIISVPIVGGMSYFRMLDISMSTNADFTAIHFAALLVITASIASFIVVATKQYVWLCSAGVGAGIAILLTLVKYFDAKQAAGSAPSETPAFARELVKAMSFQLDFGLAVVGIGTLLLFIAAFFPAK